MLTSISPAHWRRPIRLQPTCLLNMLRAVAPAPAVQAAGAGFFLVATASAGRVSARHSVGAGPRVVCAAQHTAAPQVAVPTACPGFSDLGRLVGECAHCTARVPRTPGVVPPATLGADGVVRCAARRVLGHPTRVGDLRQKAAPRPRGVMRLKVINEGDAP
jgi:hypothetical protein